MPYVPTSVRPDGKTGSNYHPLSVLPVKPCILRMDEKSADNNRLFTPSELILKGYHMTTSTHALAHYNCLFDNRKYQAVAARLAADLRVDRASVRAADGMNLITNTALNLVNHPHYTDAWLRLATFYGQNGVSIATIDLTYRYLQIFQQRKDTRADDFMFTAKALLKSYAASDPLKGAVSCANGIHGWRGRMAYQLLAASDYLVQAATQLLIDGNLSYIREKLHHGLQRLTGALYEGVRHSKRPYLFDFSETGFPRE
jgi:hypothetical protein